MGWRWDCSTVNTLRLRQNGSHFEDNIFKCIFLNENFWILDKFSLKYVAQGLIDMAALVQIMAWRRTNVDMFYCTILRQKADDVQSVRLPYPFSVYLQFLLTGTATWNRFPSKIRDVFYIILQPRVLFHQSLPIDSLAIFVSIISLPIVPFMTIVLGCFH